MGEGLGKPQQPPITFFFKNSIVVVTAVSRAQIRGAPAAVSKIKSSNVTIKPAEGGAGALSNKRGPVVLCS